MMSEKSLSRRGEQATKTELRVDMDLFFEANHDKWHKKKNPEGKFPLNMAENNLTWDILNERITTILQKEKIPKWVSNYTGLIGHEDFLEAIATFMSKHISGCDIESRHIAASAGSTAVIELCAWILCNRGDVIMIPAPCYPVYTQDINMKAGVERFDINTHHEIKEIKSGSNLNIGHLETSIRSLNQAGKVVKMLLLTNPDNPTGIAYTPKQISEIANWCIKNKIHLIVNELYALSRLIGQSAETNTTSFSQLMNDLDSEYLHMIYGFSKDFGISGMRVGLAYSKNESFLAAYKNLNAPHMVSNLTQWVLMRVLNDKKFIKNYIKENQIRLTKSYLTVTDMLDKIDIPYVDAKGSLFVWLDLSEFLSSNTDEEESILWRSLYDQYGVLLTPGTGFGHSKRGQFRLVHTFLKPSALKKAMKQIQKFVMTKRANQTA